MKHWPLDQRYSFRDQTVRFHVTGDGLPRQICAFGVFFFKQVDRRQRHMKLCHKVFVVEFFAQGERLIEFLACTLQIPLGEQSVADADDHADQY